MTAKDPFLEMRALADEIWNEKKAILYCDKRNVKRQIAKVRKLIEKLKTIDYEPELKMYENTTQKMVDKTSKRQS